MKNLAYIITFNQHDSRYCMPQCERDMNVPSVRDDLLWMNMMRKTYVISSVRIS